MSNDNKSSNFLNAIKKYNEEERAKVISEAEEKKAEILKEAETKGKADSEKLINKLLLKEQSAITGKYAIKNIEAQGELFKKRDKMVNEIFTRASDKLYEFTKTPEYKEKLLSYAREIADTFTNKSCTVYLKSDDMKFEDEIKAVFEGEVKIEGDVKIRIGGIRGYCKELKLIADNTLDSKLENERTRFIENADLKIS